MQPPGWTIGPNLTFRLSIAVATILVPRLVFGWTPETQISIADQARMVAPPDLVRQLEKHKKRYRDGVLAPFSETDNSRHVKNGDGSGSLDTVIRNETARAIRAIVSHHPFEDVVYQLGVVAHYVADANNPLNSSQDDPGEPQYFVDYLRYVDTARDRFSVVFYGPPSGAEVDIDGMVLRALDRGRKLYPLIGEEYRGVDPAEKGGFDDQSQAFGVAGVAYSHAISDIALTLRYIWLEAGGADDRDLGSLPLPLETQGFSDPSRP